MIPVFEKFSNVHAGFCNAKESPDLELPILMQQVHGADALIITHPPQAAPQCDALITKTPYLKLTVKTADCAPVLLVDAQAGIVAAVHAGWKGTFQGIIENTILSMLKQGASMDNIYAAVGPHLTQQNFQVSPEMKALFPITEQLFFHDTPHGIYFDFSGYILHRLKRIGLEHIEIYPIDTFSNLDYNSYRRDKNNPARQYSFIELMKGV